MQFRSVKLDYETSTVTLELQHPADVDVVMQRVNAEPAAAPEPRYNPEIFTFAIRQLARDGRKIEAIKLRRVVSGEYLRDAKEFVDKLDLSAIY
jgi:ribosomal protein L7/L12